MKPTPTRWHSIVGTKVRSAYRARWYGVIVRRDETTPHCVWIRQTHDRCGRPMRKERTVRLSIAWLEECHEQLLVP